MWRFAMVLVVLAAAVGCRKEQPVSACCSCVCIAQEGGVCTGAKREARGEETCEERCAAECSDKGCRLDEATVINEGSCEGGLIPFLGGAVVAGRD